jgi:hypothetical protein
MPATLHRARRRNRLCAAVAFSTEYKITDQLESMGNLCGQHDLFHFSSGDYRFDEASFAKVWPCSDEMVNSPSGFSVTAQV